MKFVIYQRSDGDWTWSLKARNGKTIGDGSEGNRRKAYVVAMCKRINPNITREVKNGS
jgi:uncharacterized protein YegP (UPF0339 family)